MTQQAEPTRGEAQGRTAAQALGFPVGARVLIINCDDLGIHPSVNAAVLEAVRQGVASSTSLMVPAPAAAQALELLHAEPEMPFGIHLTLTRDGPAHRWAPVSARDDVPSLLDEHGLLHTSAESAQLLERARIEEVERELRAQIDTVVRHGLDPTHLDWHVLADGGRGDVLELTIALALEHGLAARVWLDDGRRRARARGLPVVDHDFLDSFALPIAGKAERLLQLLRDLPAGLSEWAVHPALGAEPTTAADLGWAVRRSDHAFLVSPLTRDVVAAEGIVLTDYERLQRVWSRG
ncbi:ChbG/HpnK family deacetylase [Blastococcus sp. BMG 814]|uniref:ChbG/HpnK family deacetylase n=1 Tax=Blastococcus carthaginiensis TaxID=3050034 RepID=A0ABT9II05_9ACTN|nr:ChbG/HpnK family deacetylase [Blastococcus carthaginiensis]MDP5185212.1 ChbG/HpnK family deacetylase [Blastococcus carthaginiensis]